MSSQTNTDEIDIDIAFERLYQQIDSEPNLINVEDKLTKYMLSPKHNQYIIDIFTRFNKIINNKQLHTICKLNNKLDEYNYFHNGKFHCNSLIHELVYFSKNNHHIYEIIILILKKCEYNK
jgi:hypothetical protein